MQARLARVAAPGHAPTPPDAGRENSGRADDDPWPGGVEPARAVPDPAAGDAATALEADATAARRALAAAMASYTAAHGHPLEAAESGTPGRVRVAVPARAAVAAVLAFALVLAVVVLRVAQRSPASVTVPAPSAVTTAPGPPDSGRPSGAASAAQDVGTDAAAGGTVVVHVAGAVHGPGVVRLAAGARVADAIDAAGGATEAADLTAINLARLLADGEQVIVPEPGQVVSAPGGDQAGTGTAGSVAASGAGLIDLNQADAAALDSLPGIGPVLAERIVSWRTEHGRFTAVEELTEVSGIGPSLLARVRDLVRVG